MFGQLLDCATVLQDEAAAAEAVGASAERTLADMPVDELTTVEQVQAAMDQPDVSKTRKQKLKQRLKQLQVRPVQVTHKLKQVDGQTVLSLHEREQCMSTGSPASVPTWKSAFAGER